MDFGKNVLVKIFFLLPFMEITRFLDTISTTSR